MKKRGFKYITIHTLICILTLLPLKFGLSSEIGFKLPGDPLKGLPIFIEKRCIKCHSINPEEESFGPNLTKALKDKDVFQIYGKMWSHSLQMFRYMDEKKIPYIHFNQDELLLLLNFLYSLNLFSEKREVEKRKEIFLNSVCSNCHRIGVYGSKRGVSLDPLKIYTSPAGFASFLWNHGPLMRQKVLSSHIKWPRLAGEELTGLTKFINDFGRSPKKKRIFSDIGSPIKGKKIFTRYKCNFCHSLRSFENVKHKSAVEIAVKMWNAGPRMWKRISEKGMEIPEFSPQEFVDLISYLYFIQYPGRKGNKKSGKKIFIKNCSQCHTVGPGPSIGKIKGKYNALEVMLKMWNHTENMHKIAKEKGISWPRFLGYEMNDLIEFIARPFHTF